MNLVPGDAPNSFKFTFSAQPLNQWPSKVSLEIRAIQFKTSDVLDFPVDWSSYGGKEGRIQVPKGEDVAVAFYDSSLRLNTIDPGNWIDIEIVEPLKRNRENAPYVTMSSNPLFVDPLNNYAAGLKVTNENGDILELGGTGGGGMGNGKVGIGFGIDPDDELWKTSKSITITISKPDARLVVNEEIELN